MSTPINKKAYSSWTPVVCHRMQDHWQLVRVRIQMEHKDLKWWSQGLVKDNVPHLHNAPTADLLVKVRHQPSFSRFRNFRQALLRSKTSRDTQFSRSTNRIAVNTLQISSKCSSLAIGRTPLGNFKHHGLRSMDKVKTNQTLKINSNSHCYLKQCPLHQERML